MALQAGSVVAKFKADLTDFQRGIQKTKKDVSKLKGSFSKLHGTLNSVGGAFFSLPAAIGGLGLGALIVDVAKSGMTFKRLESTLESVRKNMGLTTDEIGNMRAELEQANLFGKEQTETLLTFLQSGLAGKVDLKKFTLMAKDYAASIGVSSTVGVKAFTKAIGTLRPELLDQFRIQFNLNEVYQNHAKAIGKKVTAMSGEEKRIALLNELYKQHDKTVKGVYTDTYDAASKAWSSFMDAMRAVKDYLGLALEPLLKEVGLRLRDFAKKSAAWLKENKDKVAEWGEKIKEVGLQIISGLGKAFTFLMKHKEIIVGVFGAIALSIAVFIAGVIAAKIVAIAVFAVISVAIALLYKAWKSNFLNIQGILKGTWSVIKWLWSGIKWFFDIFTTVLAIFISIFTGRWGAAWVLVKGLAIRGAKALAGVFRGLAGAVAGAARAMYNSMVGWLMGMWNKAKQIANKIRSAIASAFNKKKRNSPSIEDRMNDLVGFANKSLASVRVPQYSSMIADGMGGGGGMRNSVTQTINATLSDGLDVDTLAERLAFQYRNNL